MTHNTWQDFIANEMKQDYFKRINSCLKDDARTNTIYPSKEDTFKAFDLCPLDKVRVCLFGQDPYHGEGQAHGLSFSVPVGVPIPPSLRNIYKEMKSDLNIDPPKHGCLAGLCGQGVLLLNSVLTVIRGQPGSHKDLGWITFTDNAISLLNNQNRGIAFMLWGAYAKSKKALITNKQHLVLEAQHPSPYSASNGFFGCKHFSKANEFLVSNGMEPIDWRIE